MTTENSILTEVKGQTGTLWLNRPVRHNALNREMLERFLEAIDYLNSLPDIRIMIIRGKGSSFCSGADLNWMQQSSVIPDEENYRECEMLARCFFELHNCRKVTLCFVHGSSFGGANGLIAASDISIATDNAVFAFTEVRVGVVPAIISPYISARIGPAKSLELMLTGARFSSKEAQAFGLISRMVPPNEAERYLALLTEDILQGAPLVQAKIKSIIHTWKPPVDEPMLHETARLLAESRVTAEAKEGINAFVEKRKPEWNFEIQ